MSTPYSIPIACGSAEEPLVNMQLIKALIKTSKWLGGLLLRNSFGLITAIW